MDAFAWTRVPDEHDRVESRVRERTLEQGREHARAGHVEREDDRKRARHRDSQKWPLGQASSGEPDVSKRAHTRLLRTNTIAWSHGANPDNCLTFL